MGGLEVCGGEEQKMEMGKGLEGNLEEKRNGGKREISGFIILIQFSHNYSPQMTPRVLH